MTDYPTPPEVPVTPRKRLIDKLSIVWLVPIAALAGALGVAWHTYASRGPLIHIEFDNAAGIKQDETELRYRDIAVGLVEELGFNDGLDRVRVGVRVDSEVAPFIDDGARFWVVRPEVGPGGVSGLDTVLSGVYIQGAWDNARGDARKDFTGLPEAPILGADEEGITFRLISDARMPSVRTPILFKGVEVGKVDAAEISADGLRVMADAVIYAPHDTLITDQTRFWDISGFSFSLGAQGVRLNTSSLASLVQGGVSFATLGSGGAPLQEGAIYELFPDEDAARDDFLVAGAGTAVDLSLIFEENLTGLTAGAPVQLGGLRVGQVASLSGLVDPDRFGDDAVRLLVTVQVNPGRIGLPEGGDGAAFLDYLDRRVAEGMRARLTNASLLTGGLKIELVELEGAAPAALDRDAVPYPSLPTAPADVTDVTATAQGVLQRVSDLPVEEVMQSAIALMEDTRRLIADPALQDSPEELQALLASLRALAEDPQVQALPGQLGATMTDVQDGAAQVAGILRALENGGAPETLVTALEDLAATADRLPALAQDLQTLLQGTDRVVTQAQDVLANVDGAVTSVRDVAGAPELRALPAQIGDIAARLQSAAERADAALQQLDEGGAPQAASDALRDLAQAAQGLDPLVTQARALLGDAGGTLDRTDGLLGNLDGVLANVDGAVTALRRVAEADGTQALPAQLSDLTGRLSTVSGRVDGLLAEIETRGTVATLSQALEDVGTAADSLPPLIEDARRVITDAGSAAEGLDTVVANADALVTDTRALVARADTVDIDALAQRADALLTAAERLLDQDSTRDLPASLNGALQELRGTLAQLRDGALIENANATLAATRDAAQAIAQASETLPALSADLRAVARQAQATLAGLDPNAPLTRDAQAAIRDVQGAANAIERLARTIERNPNSLILGR